MNVFGRSWEQSALRLARAWLPFVAILLSSVAGVRAQGPGADGGTIPSNPISVRPILVDVEFEGNSALTNEQIQSRIQTRPTHIPIIKRYLALVSEILGRMKPGKDEPIQELVDSLGGEIRYLNLSTLAGDTVNIRKLYNDYGYHDAAISYRITLDTVRNTSIVRFIIDERGRYPVKGVAYMGLENIPDEIRTEILSEPALVPGKGFSLENVVAENQRIVEALRDNGYAFADALTPTIFTARDTALFAGAPYDSVLLFIYTGDRYKFGQTIYRTDTNFTSCTISDSLVLAQLEYEQGNWYSRRQVDQTIANMYALQTFDLVSIDTVAPLSSDSILGMAVNVRLRSLNDLRVAPEISWENRLSEYVTNFGLSATYTRLNAFCTDGHLTLTGRGLIPTRNFATPSQLFNEAQGGLGASYFIPSWPEFPFIGGRRLSGLFSANYDAAVIDRLRSSYSDGSPRLSTLRETRFGAVAELTYRFPQYTWFSLFSARFTAQYTSYTAVRRYLDHLADIRVDTTSLREANCDTTGVRDAVQQAMVNSIYRVQVLQGDDPTLHPDYRESLKRTYALSFIGVADRRNDFFSPTDGYLGEARLETGVSGGFSGMFVKAELAYRRYWQMWGFTFATRAHVGYIQEIGRLPLTPASSRFTAGGANSLRGWEARDMLATRPLVSENTNECAEPIIQSILEENRRLLGGLGLLELSIEMRRRLFNLPNSSTLGSQLNQLVGVIFADVGNAFFRDRADIVPILKNLPRYIGLAVGASLGYETPVGPFRVGFGIPVYNPVPLNLPARERWIFTRRVFGELVWHVGIGHAF